MTKMTVSVTVNLPDGVESDINLTPTCPSIDYLSREIGQVANVWHDWTSMVIVIVRK